MMKPRVRGVSAVFTSRRMPPVCLISALFRLANSLATRRGQIGYPLELPQMNQEVRIWNV